MPGKKCSPTLKVLPIYKLKQKKKKKIIIQ